MQFGIGDRAKKSDVSDIKSLIESQRGEHTWSGNIYYVDPVNGTTFAGGGIGTKLNPLLGTQDCHDNLVTDSNHDIVILIPGSTLGATILDEAVTLSKRYTFYRGPGRDFLWTTTAVGNTISITGDGIELSGFQLSTHTNGSGKGIDISGSDFTAIRNVWVNYTRGSGIDVSNSTSCIIEECTINGAGQGGSGHGITIAPAGGDSNHIRIRNLHIANISGDGIRLNGASVDHSVIENNAIHDVTGIGINILASVVDTFVTGNVLGNNGTDISDLGTNSTIVNNEQWSIV